MRLLLSQHLKDAQIAWVCVMMPPMISCKATARPVSSRAGAMARADVLLWATDFYLQVVCSGLCPWVSERNFPFFFFSFCKLTVPITCAAVKSSHSKLLCLIIHFLKKNNPPSLFKSLPFQCNQICLCSLVSTLLLLLTLFFILKMCIPVLLFLTEYS